MTNLDCLIAELCPDGVEYFELHELFTIKNGYTPSKAKPEYWEGGTLPWFRMEDIRKNGRILSDSIQHITPIAIKGQLFTANSIIIATTATIGEHALLVADSLANQRFTFLSRKLNHIEDLDPKFIFYYCYKLGEWCKDNVNASSFSSVDMDKFRRYYFPLPPLPIQQEIVRILDKFTALEAELEAELEARKKQYEYYRSHLLTFGDNVPRVKLVDIADLSRGVRVVKKQLKPEGAYPVYQNSLAPMGYYDKHNCDANTTYVISAGAAGEIGFCNKDFWAADDCLMFSNLNGVINKYIYYFLTTKQDFIRSNVRKASIPRLSRTVIENLQIPLVSFKEQTRIVSILDRFDTLVNDITQGLPAEIAARRKQYEYYRNKLLTFKEKVS